MHLKFDTFSETVTAARCNLNYVYFLFLVVVAELDVCGSVCLIAHEAGSRMSKSDSGVSDGYVDAVTESLGGMSADDWKAIKSLVAAPSDAAGLDAWDAATDAAGLDAWCAAYDAAWKAARFFATYAEWCASRNAAQLAVEEIQGADLLRERGQPFFFLPMFGFADERAIAAFTPTDQTGGEG